MRGQEEVRTFLSRLSPHEISLGVAVRELFRYADDGGQVGREVWTSAVRRAFGELRARVEGSGSAFPLGDEEALEAFLREEVEWLLDANGVARASADGAEEDRLIVSEELWSQVKDDRETVLKEVEIAVENLCQERAEDWQEEQHLAEGSRLHAEGLTKIYRKRKVVNDVAISVQQGEIVGLLGPNGAGKTTTFYMIVGLIPPNEGRVFLDDRELTGVPMYQRARLGVGYLAQEPSIFRKLTVEENVMAILETLGLSKTERKRRLENLLRELSIAHLRDNKAYSLSGGERRRLEITRALVQRPKFMLLDEPFAGIDPIAVNDIQEIVHGLKHRRIGAVISDHNVEQTLEIVDRAYIMYEGRIRVSGTVSELVWNDEVAEIYFGPTLTEKMRARYAQPGVRA